MMEKNPNAVGAAIDFVRLFVSQSEFMSLKEDDNFMNGDTLLCKVDILVGDKDAGQVQNRGCKPRPIRPGSDGGRVGSG